MARDDPSAAVAAWWQATGDALAPVVGLRGVAALRRRCLHLVSIHYPFLSPADVAGTELTAKALHDLLIAQPESDASAAGALLVHTLRALLEGLVGPLLTQRLLRGVPPPPTGGHTAQDIPP